MKCSLFSRFHTSACPFDPVIVVLSTALLIAITLSAAPPSAVAQTPQPVNFVSGKLFSGVGHGDRIPGAANVYTLALGDFNKDGSLDMVTTNDSNVWGLGLVLGNGDGTFQPPEEIEGYDTYGAYGGIVASDFNKDGNLDFAVLWLVGYGPVQLAVYLNDGTGHFTHNGDYPIGVTGYRMPRSLASGDLDGDGSLDLVVTDASNTAVAVLYGNGDGTFQSAIEYYAGATITNATAVAVGDFNKDGKPDIVVAALPTIGWAGGINVLLNNGNRTFQAPVSYTNPSKVDDPQLLVADLNADGKLDVVETSLGNWNIAIFLGIGDGTFQPAKNYTVPNVSAVALGNLTSDKKPDLVVSSTVGGVVWVLINKGSGNFQISGIYSTDFYPMSVALGDFNEDKKLDFVAGNQNGQFMTIALGNGDGTFRDTPHYNEMPGSMAWAWNIAVADFNLDGSPDVVEAGGGTGVGLSVMLGTSHGVLKAPTSIDLGANPWAQVQWVRVGDVSGDGKPDIVSGTPYGGGTFGVEVLLGLGTGKFKTPVIYPTSASSYAGAGVALVDLNGDGKPDIVTSNYDGSVSVLLNKGKGVYGAPLVIPGVTSAASNMAAGDFNNDGKGDVVLTDYGAIKTILLLGNGDGTFQAPTTIFTALRPTANAVVGDFNKDGKLDMAILSLDGICLYCGGSMAILLGNGNGTFTQQPIYYFYPQNNDYQGGFIPTSGVAVDLNGDANLDIAIAPQYPSYQVCGGYRCAEQYMGALVYLGKGDGTFVQQSGWLAGVTPAFAAAGDFNRDGMPDLAYLNNNPNLNYWTTSVTILQNATQPVSVSPLSIKFPAKVVGTNNKQTVVLTNNQTTTLTINSVAVGGANPADFTAKSACGTHLLTGANCLITVTFAPTAIGNRSATLMITDSVGVQSVQLAGVGK